MGSGGSKSKPKVLKWYKPYDVKSNNANDDLFFVTVKDSDGNDDSGLLAYFERSFRAPTGAPSFLSFLRKAGLIGSYGNDPAWGCNKDFVGTYQCGHVSTKAKTVEHTSVGFDQKVYFDCRSEHAACMNFRLELTTEGKLQFTTRDNKLITTGMANPHPFAANNAAPRTNENVNSQQPTEHVTKLNNMILDGKLPGLSRAFVQYMYPSQELTRGEYLCSKTGNCMLVLDHAGNLDVRVLKLKSEKNGETMQGIRDSKSCALYELTGLNVDNLGKVANISIDGNRRMFSTNQVAPGKKYVEITETDKTGRKILYDNPGEKLENVTNDTGAIDFCFDQCNSRDDCGGFVVSDNAPKICQLKTTDLFPVGNRVQSDVTHLYKRLYAPKNVSESCMKPENAGIVAIDSVLFDHYPTDKNDPRMRRDTLCGVDQLVQTPTQEFDTASANLASIYDTIMDKIKKTIKAQTMYNLFRNDPGMDVGGKITDYTNTTDQIKTFTDKEETVRGAEEDTRLSLISETYKYIVWSIVAVIIIIVIVIYGDIGTYANLGAIADIFNGTNENESS